MKKKHTFVLNSPFADTEYLNKLWKDYAAYVVEKSSSGGVFCFWEDSSEYGTFEKDLKHYGLMYEQRWDNIYKDDELEQVPYFMLIIYNSWRYATAQDYGNKYTAGCAYCQKGKRLIGDMYVPTLKAYRYDISQLLPEIIVGERLKRLLEECEISGIKFTNVRDARSKLIADGLYRMLIQNALPQMSPETMMDRVECSECHEILISLRSNLVYDKSDLKEAQDFNFSKEVLYDESGPCIIVSSKIRDLFIKNKVKSCTFSPICMSDSFTGGQVI